MNQPMELIVSHSMTFCGKVLNFTVHVVFSWFMIDLLNSYHVMSVEYSETWWGEEWNMKSMQPPSVDIFEWTE